MQSRDLLLSVILRTAVCEVRDSCEDYLRLRELSSVRARTDRDVFGNDKISLLILLPSRKRGRLRAACESFIGSDPNMLMRFFIALPTKFDPRIISSKLDFFQARTHSRTSLVCV